MCIFVWVSQDFTSSQKSGFCGVLLKAIRSPFSMSMWIVMPSYQPFSFFIATTCTESGRNRSSERIKRGRAWRSQWECTLKRKWKWPSFERGRTEERAPLRAREWDRDLHRAHVHHWSSTRATSSGDQLCSRSLLHSLAAARLRNLFTRIHTDKRINEFVLCVILCVCVCVPWRYVKRILPAGIALRIDKSARGSMK